VNSPGYHIALNDTMAWLYAETGQPARALRGLLQANIRQAIAPATIEAYRERLRDAGLDVERIEARIMAGEEIDEAPAAIAPDREAAGEGAPGEPTAGD
jgi:hypothetical protein